MTQEETNEKDSKDANAGKTSGTGKASSSPVPELDAETAGKIGKMSYEETRDELVKVVGQLDQGGTGLEESVRQWEYGTALAKHAQSILDSVRAKLEDVEKSQAEAGQSAGTQGNLEK